MKCFFIFFPLTLFIINIVICIYDENVSAAIAWFLVIFYFCLLQYKIYKEDAEL